jgi:DNA-binding transcriptional LysR family regulator
MSYNDLNLRQLQAFVKVAHVGSFTRAAHLLHLSQPALTKQIRQLEQTLSVRLFDRNTRTVELTRIGRDLAPVVEQLLREVEAIVVNTKELAEKSRGVIRVPRCLRSPRRFFRELLPDSGRDILESQ